LIEKPGLIPGFLVVINPKNKKPSAVAEGTGKEGVWDIQTPCGV
jgi:hypothetical protein